MAEENLLRCDAISGVGLGVAAQCCSGLYSFIPHSNT